MHVYKKNHNFLYNRVNAWVLWYSSKWDTLCPSGTQIERPHRPPRHKQWKIPFKSGAFYSKLKKKYTVIFQDYFQLRKNIKVVIFITTISTIIIMNMFYCHLSHLFLPPSKGSTHTHLRQLCLPSFIHSHPVRSRAVIMSSVRLLIQPPDSHSWIPKHRLWLRRL